jgi:hypothetical protein
MADAIAEARIALPGVSGEAATVAAFAGQWSERTNPQQPLSRATVFTNFWTPEKFPSSKVVTAGRAGRTQSNDSVEPCFPAGNR